MLTVPLLESDDCLKNWYAKIPVEFKAAFKTAFLFGLVAHMYMMTNKLPNHDEIQMLFTKNATIWLGRWFLGILSAVSSEFSLPWINGLLAILGVSVTAAATVTVLGIKKPLQIALVSALLVCFPTVGNMFAYMFTVDGYCLGLGIGAIGVYLLERNKWGWIPAVLLMTLSIASYQSNLCYFAALLAIRMLQLLLSGALNNRALVRRLLKYLLVLALAVALYLIGTKVAVAVTGIALDDYRGLSSMGAVDAFALPGRFLRAYREFFRFLFTTTRSYTTLALSAMHGCILLAEALLALLVLIRGKRPALQTVLAAACLALMPAVLMGIYLISDTNVHILMIYSLVLFYVLFVILFERYRALPEGAHAGRKAWFSALMSWCLLLALAFSTVCWTVYTNQGYLSMQLKYENSYAMALRIVDRVEQDPNYRTGMRVAIAGYYVAGNYPPSKKEKLDDIGDSAGFRSEFEYNFIPDDEQFKDFVRNYIGVVFGQLDKGTIRAIELDPRVIEMPCYPYDGSVRLIDDTLVVKVGEGLS